MFKLYEYEKCSTCKKALKFLNENKVKYERLSIVETPPTLAELKKMLVHLNGDLKKLFNTSGVVYREMGLSEKLKTLDPEQALALLAENGKLIKRPFLLGHGKGSVGFDPVEWERVLEKI